MTDDRLLVPAEFARRLGVHRDTVWRWIKKGAIPYERVGPFQKIRIRESQLARSTWKQNANPQTSAD